MLSVSQKRPPHPPPCALSSCLSNQLFEASRPQHATPHVPNPSHHTPLPRLVPPNNKHTCCPPAHRTGACWHPSRFLSFPSFLFFHFCGKHFFCASLSPTNRILLPLLAFQPPFQFFFSPDSTPLPTHSSLPTPPPYQNNTLAPFFIAPISLRPHPNCTYNPFSRLVGANFPPIFHVFFLPICGPIVVYRRPLGFPPVKCLVAFPPQIRKTKASADVPVSLALSLSTVPRPPLGPPFPKRGSPDPGFSFSRRPWPPVSFSFFF